MKAKKLLLLIALVGGISFSGVSSRTIVEYHKSGGLLGLYSNVDTWYIGSGDNGGVWTHYWDCSCSGPGVNRCRLGIAPDNGGGDAQGSELLDKVSPQINQMHDEVDVKVTNGEVSGTGFKKVVYFYPDNTKTTIVLSWVWSYDESIDDLTITLTVEDIGDVL